MDIDLILHNLIVWWKQNCSNCFIPPSILVKCDSTRIVACFVSTVPSEQTKKLKNQVLLGSVFWYVSYNLEVVGLNLTRGI